jgi:Ras-related protein Rab-11A
MSDIKFNYIYKIIMIGDSGSGKTNILSRLIDDKFIVNTRTTIGIDFQVQQFHVDGQIIKIQFWDTAGQERFRSLVRSYYKMSKGIAIVFDLTRMSTFNNIDNWITEIKDNVDSDIVDDIEILLVGNKSDLAAKREVSNEEIKQVCQKHNLKYVETSAKEDTNIILSFQNLVERVHEKGYHSLPKGSIQILDVDDSIIKQGCCYLL